MIEVGALCKRTCAVTGKNLLCQIISLYNWRDIDYDCPESVAIVPFVKAVWLSGENQGREFKSARRNFRRTWEVIDDT